MSDSFPLGDVDGFTAGAVGRPGQRVFYLQARTPAGPVTVKCEKQQVAALGEYLRELLEDLPAPADRPHGEALELREPLVPVWIAGSMAVAYDHEVDRIVVVVREVQARADDDEDDDPGDEDDDDGEDDGALLRVHLDRGQALAFAERAATLVAAGRPSCRFCGRPIDPDGHPCPRMN
jgi:uncharacterized repeat protein (TIGR03847 family)